MYSSSLDIKHPYRTRPSQNPHPVTTPVVRNVPGLCNRQNQQKCGPSGISQLPLAKRFNSVPAGKMDSFQGGSSVADTIQVQNSTPSCSLNNFRIADITQCVSSTFSATQARSIFTPTAMPGPSSHNTVAPTGIIQTDSICRIVFCPASSIAITPTPLSSPENLPTPIPNPKAGAIISNTLPTRATERNQRLTQRQLQTQAVSTPRSVFSGSRSIQLFGHSEMTCPVFAMSRILELYMWKRRLFMSASEMVTVCYATRHIAKVLAEHQQQP